MGKRRRQRRPSAGGDARADVDARAIGSCWRVQLRTQVTIAGNRQTTARQPRVALEEALGMKVKRATMRVIAGQIGNALWARKKQGEPKRERRVVARSLLWLIGTNRFSFRLV